MFVCTGLAESYCNSFAGSLAIACCWFLEQSTTFIADTPHRTFITTDDFTNFLGVSNIIFSSLILSNLFHVYCLYHFLFLSEKKEMVVILHLIMELAILAPSLFHGLSVLKERKDFCGGETTKGTLRRRIRNFSPSQRLSCLHRRSHKILLSLRDHGRYA